MPFTFTGIFDDQLGILIPEPLHSSYIMQLSHGCEMELKIKGYFDADDQCIREINKKICFRASFCIKYDDPQQRKARGLNFGDSAIHKRYGFLPGEKLTIQVMAFIEVETKWILRFTYESRKRIKVFPDREIAADERATLTYLEQKRLSPPLEFESID